MDKKRVYAAPVAELILMAPCESIAAWDWNFGNVWKSAGYHPPGTDTASAVVITGTFGPFGIGDEQNPYGDGFVIKHNNPQ